MPGPTENWCRHWQDFMSLLRTEFELILRDVSREDVSRHLHAKVVRWWSPSVLKARRDGRLKVLLRSPTAPVLNAVIIDDADGVRIVGRLRWTRHLLQVVSCAVVAITGCSLALVSDSDRLVLACSGAWFTLVLVILILTWGAVHEHEEARLRAKLRSAFGGRQQHGPTSSHKVDGPHDIA